MTKDVDWTALELDYRAGVLPVSAIAKKFNVSDHVVRSTAEKYGWERKPLDPFAIQQAHGVASSSPIGPKFSMDSDLSLQDVSKAAVLTAATVLDTHRRDVRKLREVSSKFSDALVDIFASLTLLETARDNGDPWPEELKAKMRVIGVLVGDKSPAELLEQLSRVMVRLVTIERQAYGLDVLPINPNQPAEAEAVQSQVNDLWKQVHDMQKEKTAVH